MSLSQVLGTRRTSDVGFLEFGMFSYMHCLSFSVLICIIGTLSGSWFQTMVT